MKKLFTFLLCFAVLGSISAQGLMKKFKAAAEDPSLAWANGLESGQYYPGSITTLDGEVVEGEVKFVRPLSNMALKIQFKENGTTEKYKSDELQGFTLIDKYWPAMAVNDGSIDLSDRDKIFLCPIVAEGKFKAWMEFYSEIEAFVKKEGNTTEIMPTKEMQRVWFDKEGEEMVQMNHIKFMRFGKGMAKFLSECESLVKDLEKKKYKKFEYLEVIKRYNAECG